MTARTIKDALLERYLAGDLDPALRAQLDAALAASEPDRARLEELRADSAAFLVAHPPGPLAARVEARQRKRLAWRLLVPAVALSAMALALTFATKKIPIDQQHIQLAVYAAQGGNVGPLEVATAGDAVKFLIAGRSMGFVAVLGRDASGEIHVYAPEEGKTAERYDPKTPMLPGVARLGPSAGREEIIGLFSPREFELAPVVRALREGRSLEGLLPEGSVTAVVPLEKSADDAGSRSGGY